jgi:hypothetical protein
MREVGQDVGDWGRVLKQIYCRLFLAITLPPISFLVVRVLCGWGREEFLGDWVSGGVGVSIGVVVRQVRV